MKNPNETTAKLDRRASLYKSLYNAARNCVHPSFADDTNAVRACRDHYTDTHFGAGYRELTDEQLAQAIQELQSKEIRRASVQQIKLIKYYGVQNAIIYAPLEESTFNVREFDADGNATRNLILTADEYRARLRSQFERKEQLPINVVRKLYDIYINPISNRYLIEGGYKNYCKNPNYLRFERLTQDEANYLINRFANVFNNKFNKEVPTINNNNN